MPIFDLTTDPITELTEESCEIGSIAEKIVKAICYNQSVLGKKVERIEISQSNFAELMFGKDKHNIHTMDDGHRGYIEDENGDPQLFFRGIPIKFVDSIEDITIYHN